MRLEIEFRMAGLNHFKTFTRYDHGWSENVRGFQFRIRPLFVVFTVKRGGNG